MCCAACNITGFWLPLVRILSATIGFKNAKEKKGRRKNNIYGSRNEPLVWFVDSDLVKSSPQCYLHLGQMLFTFSFDYLEKEKKKRKKKEKKKKKEKRKKKKTKAFEQDILSIYLV